MVVVVLKGTLVFSFGPNLKLKFWAGPKLNNIADIEFVVGGLKSF